METKNKYVYTYTVDSFQIGKDQDILLNVEPITILPNDQKILNINGAKYNFRETKEKVITYSIGDVLTIEGINIYFVATDKIEADHQLPTNNKLIEVTKLEHEYLEYPNYTNSPRVRRKIDTSPVKLETPPEKDQDDSIGSILKKMVPALISIMTAVAMIWLRPRGLRGVVLIAGTFIGFIMTTVLLIQTFRENKKHNEKRKKIYHDYLLERRKVLTSRKIEELASQNYNNLNQEEILFEMSNSSYRLFEKDIIDEDFLTVRIGTYLSEAKYELKNPFEKIQLDYEELEEDLKELYEEFKHVENSPLTVSLQENIGLIGSRYVMNKQIHSILSQIMFSQSYLDLNIVVITNEENKERFTYLKWLKHLKNPYTNLTNIIIDANSRDQLLSTYTQILRSRDQEENKNIRFTPQLLFIIDDYKLVQNHPIMEFLQKNNKELGFSLLYLVEKEYELPQSVKTIIDYKNLKNGLLKMEAGEYVDINFDLEKTVDDIEQLELITRKIGQLEHIKGVKSSIPEKLGFLEMYNVTNTSDLQIAKRWDENRSYKSLAALIGKKSETDYIELNLHEKVHGPHGLIAGTTGSGKSEVIQTYILSLALNYSPYEVGFLLIDYKGGGMANLFKDMPHHLGSITNLDGYQSMRALASIKSELKRRQQIFSDNDVNHINGYHKLFEKNEVSEPLPHLFLISDEFAELKAEQPEFMKELVSAARIGRSLGIHLILATQKPSGVVDEQIWSNSKFKLSLKVAEEADSKELLKTPDAAYITEAGRGYLKVGTNELYELFQSGYSGADYGVKDNEHIDRRIYVEDLFGHRKLINEEAEESGTIQEVQTELAAVLEELENINTMKKYIPIPRPWLPPLENRITMDHEFNLAKGMTVDLGIVDIPDKQEQGVYNHDFIKDGHLVIIGSSGFGKSTLVSETLLRLSLQNDSRNLKFYILDFGNGALQVLKTLNQTADYFKADETMRLEKFFKTINEEISLRKKLFEEKFVTNINSYNQKADEDKILQNVIVAIDNFDALKDMNKQFIDNIASLSNNSGSFGIYFILTGSKVGSIKGTILNNIKKRILFYTNDKSDVTSLLGKTQYPSSEIPGRMFVKGDKVEVAQAYQPVEAELEFEYVEKITQLISKINEKFTYVNEGLPNMPEILKYEVPKFNINRGIYLGKDYENVNDVFVELKSMTLYGNIQCGKTNVLKMIIDQIKDSQKKIAIFDNRKKELIKFGYYDNISLITDINEEIYDNDIYIFNSMAFLNNLDRKDEKEVHQRLYDEYTNGKIFIFESEDVIKGSSDFLKVFKKPATAIYFNNPAEQKLAKLRDKNMKDEEFELTNGYLINRGQIIKFKHPEYKETTELENLNLNELEGFKMKLGNIETELDNLVVAGENCNIIFNELVRQLDEKDEEYVLITDETKLTDLREKEKIILLDNDLISEKTRDERLEILETIEQKNPEKLIIKTTSAFRATGDFYKKFKRPTKAIIGQDLTDQPFMAIKGSANKERVLENNTGFYINGKEVAEFKIQI